MIKLKDTSTVYFDVDDTLVLWNAIGKEPPPGSITIQDTWGLVSVTPHTSHIHQLKRHKNAGHIVVVWSQGGSDWAERVVEALGLREFVDLIVTKPFIYYDDLDSSQFMGRPLYLDYRPDLLPVAATPATDSNPGIV